jgi:hypothetical protein
LEEDKMPEQSPADDLLAELNGGTGAPAAVNIDVEPVTASRDAVAALEVKPKPALSAVATADAKHATKVGGHGYSVVVIGDFTVPAKDAPGKKALRPYEVVVNVPSLDGALSLIVRKLLDGALRKKYADDGYIRFRTHSIKEARPLSPATPESTNLLYMPREALVAYIADVRAPIDPANYPDTVKLRESVMDYAQNPNGFEKREAARVADLKESAALAQLNPDIAA